MAAASLRLSANESNTIERKLELSTDVVPSKGNLEEFYEIPKCVDVINDNSFHKVALQFPDALLGDSTSVALAIKRETGAKVFVLADTSYGSCCVDEVAAEHVDAELIIHCGRACLSQTRRLPVLYIFGKWPVSIKICREEFCKLFPDTAANVLVFYDVIYSHCIEQLQNSLTASFPNIVFTKLKLSTFENKEVDVPGCEKNNLRPSGSYFCQFGREFWIPEDKQLEDYKVFYIGGESLCLTNLMMSLNKCQFYTYDPCSGVAQQETLNVNRSLMKRYYMIEKAKDAQVVGIVVGTLGVADYLQAIERLKQVIKLAGKKSYLFVVGKLNVAKMANFMEIDIFVLVACPENTLIDSQEFYKPIVTPFEMEIACLRTREWTGDYITDFRELLPGASQFIELSKEENRDDMPDISLVTGHIRPSYTSSKEMNESASTSLVQRNEEMTISTTHHTSGAEFLASRLWRGLEPKLGETPVTGAVEGRKGIAARYTHEEGSDVQSQDSTLT